MPSEIERERKKNSGDKNGLCVRPETWSREFLSRSGVSLVDKLTDATPKAKSPYPKHHEKLGRDLAAGPV